MLLNDEDKDDWFHKMGRLDEDEGLAKMLLGGGARLAYTGFWRARSEPAPRSSRPVMARIYAQVGARKQWVDCVTLHFQHSAIGAINVKSGNAGREAAEFQLYIERFNAPPQSKDGAFALKRPNEANDEPQAYDEEMLSDRLGPLSFGSAIMGHSPVERAAFWRALANFESHPRARVQGRLIVELPCEFLEHPDLCRAVIRRFIKERFLRFGLACWVTVHKPDTKHGSDPRNLHLHLVYSDRPVLERVAVGRWRFSNRKHRPARGRTYDWGTEAPSCRETRIAGRLQNPSLTALKRELLQKQLDQVRAFRETLKQKLASDRLCGVGWVATLRRRYCELVNTELLALASRGIHIIRLYDYRSYSDAGLPKVPTLHMGARQTRLERMGIPTLSGVTNRRIELAFEHIRRMEAAAIQCARADALVRAQRRRGQTLSFRPNVQPFVEWVVRSAKQEAYRAFDYAIRRLRTDVNQASSFLELSAFSRNYADPGFWCARAMKWATTQFVEKTRPKGGSSDPEFGEREWDRMMELHRYASQKSNQWQAELAPAPAASSPPPRSSRRSVPAGEEVERALRRAEFERWGTIALMASLQPASVANRRARRARSVIDQEDYRALARPGGLLGRGSLIPPPRDHIFKERRDFLFGALRNKAVSDMAKDGLYLDVPERDYATAVRLGAEIDPATGALQLRLSAPRPSMVQLLSRFRPHDDVLPTRRFIDVPPDRNEEAFDLGAGYDRRMQAFFVPAELSVYAKANLRSKFREVPRDQIRPFILDPSQTGPYRSLTQRSVASAPSPEPRRNQPALSQQQPLTREPTRRQTEGTAPPTAPPNKPPVTAVAVTPPAQKPLEPLRVDSQDKAAADTAKRAAQSMDDATLMGRFVATRELWQQAVARKNPLTVTPYLLFEIESLQTGARILSAEAARRGLSLPPMKATPAPRPIRRDRDQGW